MCVFGDVDVVVININYVFEVGFNFLKDVLKFEDKNSFYVNVFVVKFVILKNFDYFKLVRVF